MPRSMWERAIPLILALLAVPAAAEPVVKTANGAVRGVDQGATEVFFGIPYAKPPVGNLRWTAPQPAASWKGVRPAIAPSPACYQSEQGPWGPFTGEFLVEGERSEDCLYLNIWKPAKPTEKLPVFFYIHGGGFGSGSGTVPVYDGSGLAARGAIVVTINYRVGVFGFFAHPDLTREGGGTSGNYGILDMIAALEWTRANIARFGGDPDNITIAGQSAGAAAVNDLIMSPRAKGLFQRAVAQSGAGLGIEMVSLDDAEKIGVATGEAAGLRSLSDLRKLGAAELQKLTEVRPPSSAKSAPDILFAPNVDHVVLGGDPADARAPIVSVVPLLTGFNADEGLVFGAPGTPVEFEAYVRERYGDFADRFLSIYPHANAAEVATSIKDIARDRYMASLIIWCQTRTGATGQPIYAYLYDQPYPPAGGQAFGAFHTAEVPYVMGAFGKAGRPFIDSDRAVSLRMQNHWLAFMKTGDPSLPDARWARSAADDAKVMTIGSSSRMQWAVSSKARYDAFRDYVASGGKLSLF